MNNCKNCHHWQKDENRYNRAIDPEYNPATGDEWASEEEKRQLGELQFRVETMIDQVQRTTGKPMPREDKMTLMRREMATTVSQSTWLGFGTENKSSSNFGNWPVPNMLAALTM